MVRAADADAGLDPRPREAGLSEPAGCRARAMGVVSPALGPGGCIRPSREGGVPSGRVCSKTARMNSSASTVVTLALPWWR